MYLLRGYLVGLFLLSCVLGVGMPRLGAQEDGLSRDSVSVSGALAEPVLVARNFVRNAGTAAKTYRWSKTVLSGPADWSFAVCDTTACHAVTADSLQFTLRPGGTGRLDVAAYPDRVAGAAEVVLRIEDTTTGEMTYGHYFFSNQTSGLSSPLLLDISIYPNPTRDFLRVDTGGRPLRGQLFDRHGQALRHYAPDELERIDLRPLPPGVYVLRLYSPEGLQLGRLVVKG
jgi:hypothetical protein